MSEFFKERVVSEPVACPIDVYDVELIREDFPILSRRVHGNKLIYLDNAATAQKPEIVIDAVSEYYGSQNANIHRGVHFLSELASGLYEEARSKIRSLINAKSDKEIIFTRGTTESINLVAFSYGRANLKAGDEVLITTMEHHSNIVPWQLICEQTGAKLRVAPIDDNGDVIFEAYQKLLSEKTKIVAMVHISNALGTINPIKKMIEAAHSVDAAVLIDGAQSTAHVSIDVQSLDCDFMAFSGHKMYGPTGIGALYGKQEFLEAMPPYQGGGDMINSVSFEKTTYAELPYKFEAGTPNIVGAIGLGRAIDYIQKIGYAKIGQHHDFLLHYAHQALSAIDKVHIIGNARNKASLVSFVLEGIHPHDIGTILDQNGIAVRTGHHCAQPVMERFKLPATTRASFALYNTKEEIDRLVEGIYGVIKIFS